MKASVYKSTGDIYLAVLADGLEMRRGDLPDLALALRGYGIAAANLLFGDWRPDAGLLPNSEQDHLKRLLAEEQVAE